MAIPKNVFGVGRALLPDWLIKNELDSGDLVKVLPRWKTKDLPIHVVYAGERVLPTRVSAFIHFAVGYLARAQVNTTQNSSADALTASRATMMTGAARR